MDDGSEKEKTELTELLLLLISTDAVAPLTTPPRSRGRKQQRAGGVRRRFGARRFAITLVCHSAERRFGVEREPVVTYARARVCAARRSTTRPPRCRGAAVSVRRTVSATASAEREDKRGSMILRHCPTVSSKSFRPGSFPSRERDAPIEKHNSTFVP